MECNLKHDKPRARDLPSIILLQHRERRAFNITLPKSLRLILTTICEERAYTCTVVGIIPNYVPSTGLL